ncbi:STAS domain-containing protein [Streptomyces sp. KL116D]
MGLSVLLGLRRRTDEAGAALALSNRPPRLNRFLEITGTLDYLTLQPRVRAAGDGAAPEPAADHPGPHTRNETRTARHRRPCVIGLPGNQRFPGLSVATNRVRDPADRVGTRWKTVPALELPRHPSPYS